MFKYFFVDIKRKKEKDKKLKRRGKETINYLFYLLQGDVKKNSVIIKSFNIPVASIAAKRNNAKNIQCAFIVIYLIDEMQKTSFYKKTESILII